MAITKDEWLSALKAAEAAPPPSDPDVQTLKELCEVFGCGISAAERAVQRLLKAGKAERTTKVIRQVDGRWRQVPAYRLIQHHADEAGA